MSKILVAILLLAGTIFMFIQMRSTGKKLKTPQTASGILNLEFAYDNDHTSVILNAWKQGDKIGAAKKNIYLDFGFLFCYSLFLFYSCRQLSKNFSGNIRRFGMWLSKAALIAGSLDVLENSGMLITLGGNASVVVALITAICASVKWLLAIMAILYVIITSPVVLYLFIRNQKT